MDNLYNSKREVVEKIGQITNLGKNLVFYEMDLLERYNIEKVFSAHNINSVIHFCGLKAVGESVAYPLKYYRTNILTTLNLLEVMDKNF